MVKNKIIFFEYKDTKFKYENDIFYFAWIGIDGWEKVDSSKYLELYKALFN